MRLGQSECEIEVRENWGIRVVVNDKDGKEKVVWGQELRRCSSNKHNRADPYEARSYHHINRRLLKDVKLGTVVEYPVGQEYVKAKVKRIVRAGSWQRVRYSVSLSRCLHGESVRVTKKMIERARRDNRLWGAGLRPPSARLQERHVISPETFEHLQEWIFSTDLLETIKAGEQSTQRGQCFAVKEALSSTYPRYLQHADKKEVDPVTERVYRRVLSQRVFTKYRKDHCMCTTCLRSGWRGILESANKLLSQLDVLNIWPVETTPEGDKVKRSPGNLGMCTRLKRLWDFIRLELHLHMEEQSPIAAHCTRLHLGSLAEPRFNKPCTHKHSSPDTHPPQPEVLHQQPHSGCVLKHATARKRVGNYLGPKDRLSLSSTCTQYRAYWTQEWPESLWQSGHNPPICASTSDVCCSGACKKKPTCHCKHCDTSFCREHCSKELCTAEHMPKSFGTDFVCTSCAPKVDSCQHSNEGCATCSEIQYFKQVTLALYHNPQTLNPYTKPKHTGSYEMCNGFREVGYHCQGKGCL